MTTLRDQLGPIDIHLFAQILEGRVPSGARVFDVGCGGGRNLVWFLREGYSVAGVDPDAVAIARVRDLATSLASSPLSPRGFRVESVEDSSFPDGCADLVIVNAVLHFARDAGHFERMLDGAWRHLASGGLFFARLASSIGIEALVEPLGSGRFRLPDGSTRYLVTEPMLRGHEARIGAARVDPLKTTIVDGQRAMTTWVLRRA